MDVSILLLGGITGFLYAFGQKILDFLPILSHLLCRARYYHITQQDKAVIVSRKVRDRASELRDGQDASGFFCGWFYIGWITSNEKFLGGMDRKVRLFTTRGYYDELVADPNPPPSNGNTNLVTIVENVSTFHIPDYKSRVVMLTKVPNMEQQKCIDTIIEAYKTTGEGRNITVFLHGGVGTGKSMTTLLLANAMEAQHSKDLKPSAPGMSIKTIYASATPSPSTPLVLVLEEVDILLERIHNVELPAHKLLQALVADKTSWNNMLDDIDNGLFPYMITILTSNKTPDEINLLDPAYIRPGRVHVYFEMKRPHIESDDDEVLIDINHTT